MKRWLVLLAAVIVAVGAVAQEENAAEAPTVYAAFGDSITVGRGAAVGYPPRLQSRLEGNRGPSIVLNRGRDGETTGGGVSRLPGVLASDRPAVLLLMEGANDVTMQVSNVATIANLETMINMAKGAGVRVIISTLPPRSDGYLSASQQLNAQITSLAGRTGVTLADSESAVSMANLSDSIHPNAAGYEQLADEFFKRIGGGGGGGGGGCFVATVAYGDPDAPEVWQLRRFRDTWLMPFESSRRWVGAYYRFGPVAAEAVFAYPHARTVTRAVLDRLGAWIAPLPGVGPAR